MISIEFIDQISDTLEEKMRRGFIEYEHRHDIDVNYKRFSLILKDENDNPLGLLNAYTAFSEIYIEDIWVDEVHRRKGYGKELIDILWQRFEGKGFNNINLCTSDFQAPEFYKKCGFTLEFIRDNTHNPKLTKYFFVKFFKNQEQNQGTISNPPSSVKN